MNKKNNLYKNTAFLMIGTFLNKGLQFVMIPIFSRWLSTEDYGSFDLFCTYVSLMIPVVTLACGEAIFRFGVEQDTIKGKAKPISNGAAIVFINSLILLGILAVIYAVSGWKYTMPFFFMAFGEILNNYLQGYMRAIRKLNIYSFCTAFSTLSIAIASTFFVLVLKMGLSGLIWGYAVGYLMGDLMIACGTKYKKYFDFRLISWSGVKELLSYSYALIPNNISWWIINVSDRSIINVFLGAAFNGIYAIASKVPNLASAIFGVFSISWQETASDMVNSEDRDAYYSHIFNMMCRLLLPMCAGIIACNFILFGVIFDIKYDTARFYTPILVSSVVFGSLSQFFGGIQISLKRPKANGVTTMLGAVVNLIVHLSLIKFVGLYAAALSTIVSNIVIVFLRAYLLRKDVKFTLDSKMTIYILIYAYFIVMAYIRLPLILSVFNLALAAVYFILLNRDTINQVLKKLKIKVRI